MEYRKTAKNWVNFSKRAVNEIEGIEVDSGEYPDDGKSDFEDLVIYEYLIGNLKKLYEKTSSLYDESSLEDSDEILIAKKYIKAAISNLMTAHLRAKNRK